MYLPDLYLVTEDFRNYLIIKCLAKAMIVNYKRNIRFKNGAYDNTVEQLNKAGVASRAIQRSTGKTL